MITHIFHISDLHIFEKNYVNLNNSWEKLIANIIRWSNYKTTTLLVITGDIFEYKTYLNSDDVHIFYKMMNALEVNSIRTFIIPGNHDYNINTLFAQDNISILLGGATDTPLVRYVKDNQDTYWTYIKCFPKTGVYTIENIKFWVYSPIDKKIPQELLDINSNVSYTNIALLHEPIIYAKYDNGEKINNGRFRQSDLAKFNIVMLGDIHRPQMLAPNMGYAGSFVQKNRGEGLYHGYILWNILDRIGQHIWIPLKEVSIKLIAENNTITPLEDIESKITNIALIHKNCSPDWLQNTIEMIRQKYRMPINQILRQDTLSHTDEKLEINNVQSPLNSKISHSDMIRQILTKKYPNNAELELMIQRVLDYHNNFLQNRKLSPSISYKLKYLTWSNVFCYGPKNYINFENVKGLVSLSGRNKTGKSSVIDILIRILFNECERGYKEDIINKNAKMAHIKCCFTIGDSEYIIEQSWQKYSSSGTHRLFCNGENITKDTLIKTYKYIKEDLGLGNYKDFVNLTTALQNRNFIVDLDKKDTYALLCKILDIDTMKDIEEHVKKERDFLKRDKKNKIKEIEQLGCLSFDNDQWKIEFEKIEKENLEAIKEQGFLEIEIENLNNKKCELNRKIQKIDLPDNWTSASILEYLNKKDFVLPWTAEEQDNLKKELQALIIEFEVKKNKYTGLSSKKINSSNDYLKKYLSSINVPDILDDPDKNKILDELKAVAQQNKWNIGEFKTNYTIEELNMFPICKWNITELYKNIQPCNQKNIIMYSLENESIDDLQNLEDQLELIKMATKNYQIHKAKYKVAKEVIDLFNDNTSIKDKYYPIFEKYNNEYITSKNLSKQDEKEITLKINNINKYKEIQKNNHIISNNIEIEKKIEEYNKYQDVINDIKIWEAIDKNNKIELANLAWEEYCNMEKQLEQKALKSELLNIKEKVNEYKQQISKWDSINMNFVLKNDGTTHEVNIEKYEIQKKNEIYEDELKKIDEYYLSKINELKLKSAEVLTLDKKLNEMKQLYERHNQLKKIIVEIDDTINLYDLYYSCINYKTGIPSAILRQTCIILTEQCNKILNNISDFSVEFLFEEDIKIYTLHKTQTIDTRVPASMASGFQKFILDMIMRIVLTKLSNISNPNIIFIDEGFGCLDKENFNSICLCLDKLKDNFDSMIIITHISELKSYMDMNISIYRENDYSKLEYGKLTENQMDLEINNEAKKIKKQLEEKGYIEQKEQLEEKEFIDELYKVLEIDQSLFAENNNLFKKNNNNYYCESCKKSFKRLEQFKTHLTSKSYKAKHIKALTINSKKE